MQLFPAAAVAEGMHQTRNAFLGVEGLLWGSVPRREAEATHDICWLAYQACSGVSRTGGRLADW